MKYVRLSLSMAPDLRHPMHQFVVDHDGYDASYLVRGNALGEDVQTFLFHVNGHPVEPYREALDRAENVVEYAISTCPDETFYLYVRGNPSEQDHELVDALVTAGLVVVSPIAYRADGTVGLALVGPGETVQRAIEAVPDGISVDVRSVSEYDSRRFETAATLTDRQFAAVAAAVDCGYYDDPRSGTTEDVAERLDCAPGTAAEHLRKAEARVMERAVEEYSGPTRA